MSSRWGETTWGEVATLEYGKAIREYQNAKGLFPVYGTNGPIGWHHTPLCHSAGVVIGRKGAYRGIHYSSKPFFVIDTAFYLKPKERVNMKWAYYCLLTYDINGMDSGSAIPSTSRDEFYKLPVKIPSWNEQERIAEVLSMFDDRITLLRETNATLEAIAQAMFKSWFVDFDPVHAKQQGRAPEGMDEANAALFPDSFEESELGLIPMGWGIRKAETLLTRLSTKIRYTKEQVSTSGTIPVYEQGAKILLGYHENAAQFAATPNEPMFIFGDHTCVSHLSCELFDISMNVIPLKGSDRPTLWTYYAVKDKQTFQEYRRHWMELAVKDVVVAPQEICNQFSLIASALHVKMESNSWQANTLATLRDTLLPRLISGQLRLPEAEALIEEV